MQGNAIKAVGDWELDVLAIPFSKDTDGQWFDENTDIPWPIWRLILQGVATLQEIETHWSLSDVVAANRALDAKLDAERQAYEKQKAAK